MTPSLDARSAEAACAAYEQGGTVCDECREIRAERACPPWRDGE